MNKMIKKRKYTYEYTTKDFSKGYVIAGNSKGAKTKSGYSKISLYSRKPRMDLM